MELFEIRDIGGTIENGPHKKQSRVLTEASVAGEKASARTEEQVGLEEEGRGEEWATEQDADELGQEQRQGRASL